MIPDVKYYNLLKLSFKIISFFYITKLIYDCVYSICIVFLKYVRDQISSNIHLLFLNLLLVFECCPPLGAIQLRRARDASRILLLFLVSFSLANSSAISVNKHRKLFWTRIGLLLICRAGHKVNFNSISALCMVINVKICKSVCVVSFGTDNFVDYFVDDGNIAA